MENYDSKNILLSVLGIAILLIALVGFSYAIFTFTYNSSQHNVLTTGAIRMAYIEGLTNVIDIKKAIPIRDEIGVLQKDYFDFQVSSKITGKTKINYQVIVRNITNEVKSDKKSLDPSKIKIYLEKENGSIYETVKGPIKFSDLTGTTDDLENNKILYIGQFSNDGFGTIEESTKFKLRMWLDEDAELDANQKIFKIKVDIKATTE